VAKPKTVTSLYLVPADRRVLEKAAKKAGLPLTVFIKRCALRFAVCRECRDSYHTRNFKRLQAWRKQYNRKNRSKKRERDLLRRQEGKAFVDAFKRKPCADCGRRFPAVAMDLDHVRGTKFRNIASLVSGAYRLELIKAELKKCEVVCACCHRVRTAKRKQNYGPRPKSRASERLVILR
jgi:hypothetical protein